MALPSYPSKVPTKLLLEQALGLLLPSFLPTSDPDAAASSSLFCVPPSVVRAEPLATWHTSSGLRAVWTTFQEPVFATTTVTLRVLLPGQSKELVAKQSLSDLVLAKAHSERAVTELLSAAVKSCCQLLAPHLYEHDPRRGSMVSNTRPEFPANLLFDPPGHGVLAMNPSDPCAVCRENFLVGFPILAVWGGGNLGFLHVECCEAVGVSLRS